MNTNIPFTVLGGYLGAGKTTLLNHLLTNTQGLRIAVLVNDFGSVNIDVGLIRSHAGDTINLANGCMCCSIANNFALVMKELGDRRQDFDHIVIEASGVANPGKIAQYGQMYQLPLSGVMVVADGEQVRVQAHNKYVGDTVVRQLAQADVIILNKLDLISQTNQDSLQNWLTAIAPHTPIFPTVQAQVPTAILLGDYQAHVDPLSDRLGATPTDHRQRFETWTIDVSQPLTQETLTHFAASLGENIYRVKGLVWLATEPDHRHIYQQVGRRWSLEKETPWGDRAPHSQLVVIGQPGTTALSSLRALLSGT